MPSRPLRSFRWHVLAPVIIAAIALLHCGCDSGNSSETGGAADGKTPQKTQSTDAAKKSATADHDPAHDETAKDAKPAAPPPLLAAWKKPAAAIVVTGEQHGYFEPCGCTAMQVGGMSRRSDLVKQLKDKGWAVTGVDVGGSTLRDSRQSLLKFQTMIEALRDMNYRALAIGPEELRLGLDNLLQMLSYDPNSPDDTLSLMSANVVFYDSPDLGTPRPWRIIKVGDVKIGVTAILSQDFNGTALLRKNNRDLTIKDPTEALPPVIARAKEGIARCDAIAVARRFGRVARPREKVSRIRSHCFRRRSGRTGRHTRENREIAAVDDGSKRKVRRRGGILSRCRRKVSFRAGRAAPRPVSRLARNCRADARLPDTSQGRKAGGQSPGRHPYRPSVRRHVRGRSKVWRMPHEGFCQVEDDQPLARFRKPRTPATANPTTASRAFSTRSVWPATSPVGSPSEYSATTRGSSTPSLRKMMRKNR